VELADLEIMRYELMNKGLIYIKEALLKGINDEDELKKAIGLSNDEIILLKHFLETDSLVSIPPYKIDAKAFELEKKISEIKEKLFETYKMYIFYNWRKGIKARWLGLYRGKNIRAISRSVVIFISAKEISWFDIAGRECKGLIGNGLYFIEFVPEDVSETITFYKNIHGIMLTKKSYDELLVTPPRIIGRYEDMHRELISVIPLSQIMRDKSARNFLKGILVTTLLRDKHLFILFLENIRKISNQVIREKDLAFLSGLPDFHNKLMISSERYSEILEGGEEALSIPGLAGYEPKLEKLNDFLSVISLEEIKEIVNSSSRKIIKYLWQLLLSLIT